MHVAAFKGQTAVVGLLLEKGANVNQGDIDGFTPLHIAAQKGRAEIVELLLAKGADANQGNKQGVIPWDCANEKGHDNVLEKLPSVSSISRHFARIGRLFTSDEEIAQVQNNINNSR